LTKKLAEMLAAAIALKKRGRGKGGERRRGRGFTASDLGVAAGCKPDVAHHRIQRMIELGVIKNVTNVTPARYVVG